MAQVFIGPTFRKPIRLLGGLLLGKNAGPLREVINKTGVDIAVDKLVTITGFDGTSGLPTITLADADAAGKIAHGVTLAAIANGATGYIYTNGLSAANLNTNAGNVGDPVYLHTTAGGWTLSASSAANARNQVVGLVKVKSATVGQIAWHILPTQKIGSNEIQSGVLLTTAADGVTLDTLGAGSTLEVAAGGISATQLNASLKVGTIWLPMHNARLLATNDYVNIAAAGGILATNTDPSIARVNGATDISPRITWAANSVVEVQWEGVLPADLDDTVDGTLVATLSMGGAMDTPTVTAKMMVGIGGSDLGGATTALSATPTDKTRTINFPTGAAGNKFAISLTPGAHANDAVRLDGLYLKYTRK